MEATTQPSIHQPSIHQRFGSLAASDLEQFREFFRRLHKAFPEQAAEACLFYIAAHGLDRAAKTMTGWLLINPIYVTVLLDVDSIPEKSAFKVISALKDVDAQFPIRFTKACTSLNTPQAILRALGLLPALGDYSILIPWLRFLGQHSDVRVRSCSAKLLCELRPNKGQIERQMQSADARVRASAVDTLLRVKAEDTKPMLRAALSDPHHRVVANALVALYQLGETDMINQMIELCGHKQQLFRAAIAWALGAVRDARGIPALRKLAIDPSLVVRKRALNSLLLLESLKTAADETDAVVQTPEYVAEPVPEPAPEEVRSADAASEQEPTIEQSEFNFSLFK